MTARRDGVCRWCKQPFSRGAEIYWDSRVGADHADCAQDRAAAQGEPEPERGRGNPFEEQGDLFR